MSARCAICGLTLTVLAAACGGSQIAGEEKSADAAPQAAATAGTATLSSVYTNDRFGYSVRYPTGRFTRAEVPQNNDGMRFEGIAGQKFTVFGTNNALGLSFDQQVDEQRAQFAELSEDRQEGNRWTGFGFDEEGKWRAVQLLRTGDDQIITARFTARRNASYETRELGRSMVTSLGETGTGS